MILLQGSPDMVRVVAEPVISVAQQMAFYLSVSQDAIRFDSSDEDSCTVEVNGVYFDVALNPVDGMVIDWFPA